MLGPLSRLLLGLLVTAAVAGPASADWTTNGERVYASSINGFFSRPDGRGGLLLGVHYDGTNMTRTFYAQHVDSSGARLVGWPADGFPIAAPRQEGTPPAMGASGVGGACGWCGVSAYPAGVS